MSKKCPFYLANQAQTPNTDLEVVDKFTGEVAYEVAMADKPTPGGGISRTTKFSPTST